MITRYPLTHILYPVLGIFISASLLSQNITGDWHGILDAGPVKLKVSIHISEEEGVYLATADIPDQGTVGLPLDNVNFMGQTLSFDIDAASASYLGNVDLQLQEIDGVFSQAGQKFPLVFSRSFPEEILTGSTEWLKERLQKEEMYITMRDGVRLFTSVYTPSDTSQTYPILLWRTPYNIEPAGSDAFNFRLGLLSHLVEAGYIMVFQDVRGKAMSEGTFVDVRPYIPNKKSNEEIDENSDTYDTIDWLIRNLKGNNGRVGILGISYPGFYSTISLPDAHPALKAVSPQAPVTDWFIGDDFHHNGAFFLMDAFNFYSSFGKPRPEPTRAQSAGFSYPNEDNYDFFMELGPIKNVKERYFGDTMQFWNDLMEHPNYDSFWKARTPLPHLKEIRPAVLTVGGWFDAEDSYGPLRVYEAIEDQNPPTTQNRLIMGPWYHGQWAFDDGTNMGNVHWMQPTGPYYKEVELEFFNFYLKDEGEMSLPEANMFITGNNEWKAFDEWPPGESERHRLYFLPGGGLQFGDPGEESTYEEYISDPMKPVPYTEDVHLSRTREYMTDDQRFASRRPDVMVFETPILEEDVTFTGPLQANLWFSTTGTDADFVVKLIDVFPDTLDQYPENEKEVPMAGYQMMVRGDILRGRFRNSFENPEPFTPGEITEVSFELPDVGHTFKAGHRIMIHVQHSWFPLVDRNPQKFVDIYQCEEEDFQKAIHRLYLGGETASYLDVGVLKN